MIPSVTSVSGSPVVPIFALLVVYAFFAFCLSAIAKKTSEAGVAWWGWVPVLQVLLILRIGGVDWWWIFFFLIPFVNIAVAIFVWVKVAKALAKHPIWGVLMVVPGVDLFVLAYLAFSKPALPA